MILSYILLMIPPIYHIEDRTIDQAAHFTTILSFVSLIYSGSILHYLKGGRRNNDRLSSPSFPSLVSLV